MNTSSTPAAPAGVANPGETCPVWCTDHVHASDGSGNWHESEDRAAGGFVFHISAGTASGDVELFLDNYPSDGIPLEDAEAMARGILGMVEEARA